jgi:ketosteroid isomerase-like protein
MLPRRIVLLIAGSGAIALVVSSCAKEPDADSSATASGSVATDAEARESVRRQSNRLTALWPTGNVDSIMPLFTDDAVLAFPDARDARGQAAIREMLTNAFGSLKVESLEAHIDTIEVFDDAAYEWGTYHERYAETGKPAVQVEGRYLFRWARASDGTWRISRFTGNDIKREPATAVK